MSLKAFKAYNNKVVERNDSEIDEIIIDLFKSMKLKNNKFENLMYISNIRAIKKPIFLTPSIKGAFYYL